MPKTIALVEDERLLSELLQKVLELAGYRVTLPQNPHSLIEELRAQRPHAVLVDVNLREADGFDLLGKIRADEELKDLIVILSSGMDYRDRSRQAGASAFLMKPYPPGDLLDILEAHLAN